jgi:hypothetical protein
VPSSRADAQRMDSENLGWTIGACVICPRDWNLLPGKTVRACYLVSNPRRLLPLTRDCKLAKSGRLCSWLVCLDLSGEEGSS